MYICPKCGNKLSLKERRYLCAEGHSYDISSQGYVNLLLGNRKNSSHGDNKMMLSSRRAFLALGHYSLIISKIEEIILSSVNTNNLTIIDTGCGEGYYTSGLSDLLEKSGRRAEIFGVDVSKDAAAMAAKAYKNISFSVASVNALPFADSCADIILSLFAPIAEKEFFRVLKPGRILITVSPSPRHLMGLKEKIYDAPYENPPSTFVPEFFNKVCEETLTSEMQLENQEQIMNLFTMTPYYYKTGLQGHDRVRGLSELKTEIGFVFGVYKK